MRISGPHVLIMGLEQDEPTAVPMLRNVTALLLVSVCCVMWRTTAELPLQVDFANCFAHVAKLVVGVTRQLRAARDCQHLQNTA